MSGNKDPNGEPSRDSSVSRRPYNDEDRWRNDDPRYRTRSPIGRRDRHYSREYDDMYQRQYSVRRSAEFAHCDRYYDERYYDDSNDYYPSDDRNRRSYGRPSRERYEEHHRDAYPPRKLCLVLVFILCGGCGCLNGKYAVMAYMARLRFFSSLVSQDIYVIVTPITPDCKISLCLTI